MQVYYSVVLGLILIFTIGIYLDLRFYVNSENYLCFKYTVIKEQYDGSPLKIGYSYKLFKLKHTDYDTPF